MDVLIRGGQVIDGSGGGPIKADLLISGERIERIGPLPSELSEKVQTVIDATNLIVAPGFIDAHGHTGYELLVDPFAESKVAQGITTEISGNCGFSPGPLLIEPLQRERDEWCSRYGLEVRWRKIGEFLDILESQGIGYNYATLVGHGVIRADVVGYEARPPKGDELNRMRYLLEEALEQGAIGMSSGLFYPPGSYSKIDELISLCQVLRKFDGVYATHMRDEGDKLIESVREAIETARSSGVPLQISHHKATRKRNWGKVKRTLSMIEEANARGVDVSCDQYPYTAGATSLKMLIPKWAHEGGDERLLRRLSEPEALGKIRSYLEDLYPMKDDWHTVMISEVVCEQLKRFEGKRLDEVADQLNTSPFDALIYLLNQDKARTSMITFLMCEDDVIEVMRFSRTMFGTDGSVKGFGGKLKLGKPHPRCFGTFPRILGRYVRQNGVLTLPEAIRRMTSFPAEKFRLKERGLIRRGYFADIVIFDPDRIIDVGTYENPQ
ncbi:TPA: D-aminoacylase, partial [Candidatus Poribacteria bacterium]|nr:D-aminoacylase [Candidatus Poribacteria bacterium]